jgi:hypothetical protein
MLAVISRTDVTGQVCAGRTGSRDVPARSCNKLSATCAKRPGTRDFLSYIAVPDRLDSSRVLRFRNEFQVQSSKFKVGKMQPASPHL